MRLLSVVFALLAGLGGAARAQSFNPRLFHPAPGRDDFVTVESGAVLPHLGMGAGLYFDYARNPLEILTFSHTGDPYGARVQVQRHVLGAEAMFGLGLWDRLQIALAWPLTLYQAGDSFDGTFPAPDGVHVRPASGFALGDPRLYLKVLLYGKALGIQLAVSHWLSVPIGNDAAFGGEPHFAGFSGEPRLLGEWIGARFSVGLSVGFQWRAQTSSYFTVGAGQTLTYGLAGGVDFLGGKLRLIGELYGHHDFHPDADYTAASPLELDVSLRHRLPRGFAITCGVGAGVLQGAGAPLPRVFVGASYATAVRDRDGDGIPDSHDACPDKPEDRDGYQDEDGCPDYDNDGDSIIDSEDQCPNQAEDFDGFEDNDGCPDPDNDKDGIPDEHDACPNEAEDGKGPAPRDGCPMSKTDSDGDGIPDDQDKCPSEPEDKDGFQDDDGCPDPDNDGDGVPDAFDECPNDAEDVDNGQDTDGCPDYGATHLKIKDGQIVLNDPIKFERRVPAMDSLAELDDVVAVLKKRPEISLRIEGYAASDEPEATAKAISDSESEAVRRYLVKHGVPAKRVGAVGYGAEGEHSVRRIELHIVK